VQAIYTDRLLAESKVLSVYSVMPVIQIVKIIGLRQQNVIAPPEAFQFLAR
jgi:hypothetical protein